MESVIYKVTELDKEIRLKVKKLEQKREELPLFLRDHKKDLIKEQQTKANKEISTKKQEIENTLKDAKNRAKIELEEHKIKIEKSYKKNKDSWIEEIYNQCIENYMED